MASVTFPTRLGGSGITITDDADPNTGMLNGGHQKRFVPALRGVVDMAQYVYQYAAKIDQAASDAERAEDARAYVEGYAVALRGNLRAEYLSLATMSFDFVRGRYFVDDGLESIETGHLQDAATFSRASTKRLQLASGAQKDIASDVPGRGFVGGRHRGLLLEQARTNRVLQSSKFEDSYWSKSGVTVKSYGEYYSIEKAAGEAYRNIATTSLDLPANEFVCAWARVTARSSAKASLFISGDGGATSHARVVFDLLTGEVTNGSSSGLIRAGVIDAGGNNEKIIYLTARLDTVSNPRLYVYPGSYDKTAYASINLYHVEVEQGLYPTTPIATSGTSSTRGADRFVRTLGDEFGRQAGTVLLDCTAYPSSAIYNYLLFLSSSRERAGNDWIGVRMTSLAEGDQCSLDIRTSTDGSLEKHVFNARVPARVALSFEGNRIRLAMNGEVVESVFDDALVRQIAYLKLASSSAGAEFCMDVRGLQYWPRSFNVSELQELTA